MEGDPSQPVAANALPATGTAISPECQGFDFSGLIYSPGGTALPNKCEAFHPTLNNPYAVRCIDAWPWWQTEFPGDQFCILPPPPGQGIQIGHHPQGTAWFEQVSQGDMSGYTNIAPSWMLAPGGEEERNINVQFQNEAGNFYRVYSRMRGGSHHMIVSSIDPPAQTDTWALGGADGLFTGRGLPGAQRPDENGPQSLEKPAEDAGLYREFPANALITYNMHHFNSTDSNILKEAWQNLWWESDATIRVGSVDGLPLLQAVGTFAQPGQTVDMHYASTVPEPTRILALFGHRHAWTTNFTAWVERPGAQPEIVYQSFDWFDEPTYTYNSQVQNNPPNPEGRIDGAHSGILNLDVGDELHFNCHIEYTQERAVQENSPVLPAENGALRFSNQAFAGEMCILFGSAVGNNGSMMPMGPPPDFATVD
ncbi:MAG: hypothetical protein OEZ06_14310 [Myxococcales bacterium]|nr:hypothetical protein [Myxococcales bacterium]